jgi:cell wall-associated NlpC family hydrolase
MPGTVPTTIVTLRQKLVDAANKAATSSFRKPYTPNGRTTAGFDCSGFVTYVYQQVFPGYIHLNTDGIESSRLFKKVLKPQPGDLIFFPKGVNPWDQMRHPYHVGIVLDSNRWISSQTSTGVWPVKMNNPWWSSRSKYFLQCALLP